MTTPVESFSGGRTKASFLESFTGKPQHPKQPRNQIKETRGSLFPLENTRTNPVTNRRQGMGIARFRQLAARSQAMSGTEATAREKIFGEKMGVLSARSTSRSRKGGKGGGVDSLVAAGKSLVNKAKEKVTAVAKRVKSAVKSALFGKSRPATNVKKEPVTQRPTGVKKPVTEADWCQGPCHREAHVSRRGFDGRPS